MPGQVSLLSASQRYFCRPAFARSTWSSWITTGSTGFDLLAALIKASSTTLADVYIDYGRDPGWREVEHALPAAFEPAAGPLTSLRWRIGGDAPGPFPFVPAILAVLPNLTTIDIPLDVAPLPQLTEALRGRDRPIKVLSLYDRDACSSESWDDLIALLEAVRVEHVGVEEHGWDELWEFHQAEMEMILTAEEKDEWDREMERMRARVEAVGVGFEWLEWRDTR